jgi:antitoxin FitA
LARGLPKKSCEIDAKPLNCNHFIIVLVISVHHASLTIRNIPQPVLDRLKARARQNHRSMQGEIRAILEDAAIAPRRSLSEAYARMRATGVTSAAASATLIRADRDVR